MLSPTFADIFITRGNEAWINFGTEKNVTKIVDKRKSFTLWGVILRNV